MLEAYQHIWDNRLRLVRRSSEQAIQNYIARLQPKSDEVMYYDWHPTDGFVAYLNKDAVVSDLRGLEDYQHKWVNRERLTNRVSEQSIKNCIANKQHFFTETLYYDWHPTDGFVAYRIR